MWEHGHIGKIGQIIFLHRHLPPVQINAVAHGLKGEKTDAYRKSQAKRPEPCVEKAVYRIDKEIRILKKSQHGKIDYYRTAEEQPPPSLCGSKPCHEPSIRVIHC